jgi:hypothetical protein
MTTRRERAFGSIEGVNKTLRHTLGPPGVLSPWPSASALIVYQFDALGTEVDVSSWAQARVA